MIYNKILLPFDFKCVWMGKRKKRKKCERKSKIDIFGIFIKGHPNIRTIIK